VIGIFLRPRINTVGQSLGILEDLIERCFEPHLDVSADEVAGKEEEKKSRDEREEDKEEHELRFEVGSCHFPPSFEVELDQITPEDEQEYQEEKDDDDLEGGEEDVCDGGRRELLGFPDEKLDSEKEENEKDDDCSDETWTFF